MCVLLSANWGQASIIALLGFLLVVILLALLVLVLILFSKIMVKSVKPAAKSSSRKDAAGQPASSVETLSSEELVAIALAIHMAQEPEHDKETKVLTIKPVLNSAWASKAYGINNLIR